MRLGEMKFPKDVSAIILDYARIWTIAPWVPDPWDLHISKDFVFFTMSFVRSHCLCLNPLAGDEFSEDDFTINLYGNPASWAVDICLPMIKSYRHLINEMTRNTNHEVIEFIRSQSKIYTTKFPLLLSNPAAIDIIRDIFVKSPGLYSNQDKLIVLRNPSAEPRDLPDCSDEEKLQYCARNPAPWAIEFLQKNIKTPEEIKYYPDIFLNPHPWAISIIQEFVTMFKDDHRGNTEYQEWDFLSSNPAAIDILKEYPYMITTSIWENPGIFEPTIRPGVSDILNDLTWSAS